MPLRRAQLLQLAVASALAGCHADDGAPAAEPSPAAQAAFDSLVAPLLAERCARCHDADALAGEIDLDEPEASLLVTKGEHKGPAWSAAQVDTIVAWIVLDAGR